MSIISEALSKAQTTRTQTGADQERPGAKETPSPKGEAKKILLLILILSLAGVVYLYHPSFFSRPLASSQYPTKDAGFEAMETAPAAARNTNLPRLTGIMYSRESPCALINGKLVGEGARTGNFTVEKVSPNSVIISRDGQQYELRMR